MKKNIFIGLAILFLLFTTAQKIYAGGINTWNAFMCLIEIVLILLSLVPASIISLSSVITQLNVCPLIKEELLQELTFNTLPS